jgi:hypothetical protein
MVYLASNHRLPEMHRHHLREGQGIVLELLLKAKLVYPAWYKILDVPKTRGVVEGPKEKKRL